MFQQEEHSISTINTIYFSDDSIEKVFALKISDITEFTGNVRFKPMNFLENQIDTVLGEYFRYLPDILSQNLTSIGSILKYSKSGINCS